MDTSLPENKLQCAKCKNHIRFERCTAFPNGIPEAILSGEHDHRKSYKNDNGIKFEPIQGAEL